MQQLLQDLHRANVDMHAITNYPVWYKLIEEKLQLSRYLDWTFMSCEGVMQVRCGRGCTRNVVMRAPSIASLSAGGCMVRTIAMRCT
jgi:hypothetical protein